MKPAFKKGQLKSWDDSRGFGFIKPSSGGKEVFLHISALKGAGRRPKAGDTILYDIRIEASGKISAARASIQGASSHSRKVPRSRRKMGLIETSIGIFVVAAFALSVMHLNGSRSPSFVTSILKPGCTIKGDISIATGNKIYHLPEMEDYESTVIDPSKGERWFCTESEAVPAGWRKAPR